MLTERAIEGATGSSPMASGTQFTTPGAGGSAVPLIREALAAGEIFRAHAFELACARAGIDHRTTKPRHPWSEEDQTTVQWTVGPTNGQVERMNRTLKEATVQRFHYESHDQLRRHLNDFVHAYNFARRLKTLKGLTPYEFICKTWASEPHRFTANPLHQMPGLNIQRTTPPPSGLCSAPLCGCAGRST